MAKLGPITDGAKDLYIAELKQTCPAYPSQWEGRLVDNRAIYIRYRGVLYVQVSGPGGTIEDALDREPLYRKRAQEEFPGGISLDTVKMLTGLKGPNRIIV